MFIESKRLEENGRSFPRNTYAKMSSILMTFAYLKESKVKWKCHFNKLKNL